MTDYSARAVKAWDTRGRNREADRVGESDGLGVWSADGKWTPNDSEASRAWGKGKGVVPGDVPIPYPVWTQHDREFDLLLGKDWWTGNRPINKDEPVARAVKNPQSPMLVDVKDLIATQHVVVGSQIMGLVARLKSGGRARSIPIIVRAGGKSFIYDGHHRATAAKVMGQTKVEAIVWDIPTPASMLTRARF